MTRADKSKNTTRILVGVLLLLLLAGVGVGGWLIGRDDDDHKTMKDASVAGVIGLKPGVPKLVTIDELKDLGAEQGPIYWAGPRKGTKLEVTVTTQGGTYVRYLPEDAEVGTKDLYLTIGTYDSINGYNALAAAKKKDADVEVSKSGAVIATFKSAPKSTYFSFPEATFQVEVFSPKDKEARELTESGAIGLVTR